MNCSVVEISSLNASEVNILWKLHSTYFENVSLDIFSKDLKEKDWIIAQWNEVGEIQGFTTLALHEFDDNGQIIKVFLSGDTIMTRDQWHCSKINQKWLKHVGKVIESQQDIDHYWMLICSGYRTYRYMPVFWKEFIPSSLNTDSHLKSLKDRLAQHYYGERYDKRTGLVIFQTPQVLKRGISDLTIERMKNRHVQHFLKLNPGFLKGDELVCLTKLNMENQTPVCKKLHTLPQSFKQRNVHPVSVWIKSLQLENDCFEKSLISPMTTQEKILLDILRNNEKSLFGKRHNFHGINSLDEYSKHIPLSTWDDMNDDVKKIRHGADQVRTTEKVDLFMPTSGSTAARKLIPVTKSWQKEIRNALGPWITDMFMTFPQTQAGTMYWSISPHIDMSLEDDVVPISFEEDTIILGKEMAQTLVKAFAVNPDVCGAPTTNAFRYATAFDLLRASDITFISTWHPSFLTILLDEITSHWDCLLQDLRTGICRPPGSMWELKRPPSEKRFHDLSNLNVYEYKTIWPKLALISCWADSRAAAGARELRALFPHVPLQGKGLLSTEGVVSIPWKGHYPLAITSHVIEFINEDDLSIPLDTAKVGNRYKIALTTSAGLYRYLTGDEIKVTGFVSGTPEIQFTGRGNLVSDLRGEKLTDSFVSEILTSLKTYACITPNKNKDGYLLLHSKPFDIDLDRIDENLRKNPQYDWARRIGQLKPLRCIKMSPNFIKNYIDHAIDRGTCAGQVKTPSLIIDAVLANRLISVENLTVAQRSLLSDEEALYCDSVVIDDLKESGQIF